jgi:hypothetical protein
MIIRNTLRALLALALGATAPVFAQNVNVNPGAGSYPDLATAFGAINAGTHTGAITVSIVGDTAEGAPGAVLNASGAGAASYTSILITPVGARVVTGAATAGLPLIDLNGADNVTIDGLNASGNSLAITNTTVSSTAGTSTIRLINDATSNTIQNATINGAGTATSTGTIFFSNTAGTTGNDNNIVTGCNVGPAGTTPTIAVLSAGTTTTLAQRNSGNLITSNNIFDFYNAGGVVASGVLAGGASDWTITGNSFYQTVSRAMAATSGFIGVSIADTTGVNFVISNNFVGGSAASAGGAAWTQTGATTHTFIGIRMSVGAATPSSLQNNTIRNIAVTTSSASTINSGIAAVTGSMNIGTITGNTIGSGTGTGSITWTGGGTATLTGILAGTGTAGVIAISNNTIGSITVTGAAANVFRAINTQLTATSYTISGNTIGSTTTANSISNSTNGLLHGISSSSSSTSVTISNNTIANLTTTGTGTGNVLYGVLSSTGINTIIGNTIRNLTTSGVSTGTGSTSTSVSGIVVSGSTAGQTISQNTIHSLSNTAAAAAVSVTGIYWFNSSNSAATNIVERNFVHSLSTTSNGAAILNGIYTFNGGATFRNNMIRLGVDAAGSSLTSGALIINGIQADTATAAVNNWYFNSVFIGGTGVGAGTATTNGFRRVIVDITDFRDNIVVNNRSNGAGTGKHYAININATTTFTANGNNFHGIGTGAVFGVVGATDSATIAAWRTATSQDANSFFSDPAFLDATGNAAAVDLHINPAITTVVEGNGVGLATPTNDFDGQARAGLTPVDIGADAGNFMGIDLTAPNIAYSALANTSSISNRVIVTTITDISGVAGGATAPRVYFRKNAGTYFSTQCTGSSPNYTCTIDNAPMGGVVGGDAVNYYVIAQDTVGNVGSNPSAGLVASDVNTVATPPTSPNAYSIVPAVPATLNVGSGETITSLTNAGGLFATLNGSVFNSNVVVTITSDLLAETGAFALNAFAEEGGSGFTLLIRPSGVRQVIGSVATNAMIDFNGADRITIDGLNDGSNTLLIRNTGVAPAIRWVNDASDGVLRNTTVEGGSSSILVAIAGGTVTGNDNIQIVNNVLRDRTDAVGVPFNVVGSISTLTALPNSGIVISGNSIQNFGQAGVFVGVGTENITVAGNTIFQTAARTTNLLGIAVNGALGSNQFVGNTVRDLTTTLATTGMVFNDVRNTIVARNRIFNLPSTAGSTGAVSGLIYQGGSAVPSSITLVNNFVSIVPAFTNNQIVRGIVDFGFGGNTFAANFNSVYLGGTASGSSSWAMVRRDVTPTNHSSRNNVLFNDRTGGVNNFAYGDQSANTGTFNSNFNFLSGAGANFMDYGTAAAGTPVTLATWQAGPPARDANSVAGPFAPLGDFFVNAPAGDLHILTTAAPVISAGTPVVGVTADIDGETRHPVTPEIGADELNSPPSITPEAAGITRQQDTAVSNSQIAVVSDVETANGSLVVTTEGALPTGITVTNIANSSGNITADVAASCSAAPGANLVGLRVTDGDALFTDANLTVNVTANTGPTLGVYPASNATTGTGTTVTPNAVPTDNGTIATVTASAPLPFAGSFLVNTTSGVVTVSNAGPAGIYTVTVIAEDACGAQTQTTFQLTVSDANTAPVLTAATAITRQAGTTGTGSPLANVTDLETLPGNVSVVAQSVPAGLTVTDIVNSAGAITGIVEAACNAVVGSNTVVLRATDEGSLTDDENFTVNVTANNGPTVSYNAGAVLIGTGTVLTPSAAPADNGSVTNVQIQSQGTFTGTASVDSNGVITLANAAPLGTHTITVRLTDNCNANTDVQVTVTVVPEAIFADGFEPPIRAPAIVQLPQPIDGKALSQALPMWELQELARQQDAVAAIAFMIGNERHVLEVREFNGLREVRLTGPKGSSPWLNLNQAGGISLEWQAQRVDGELRFNVRLNPAH